MNTSTRMQPLWIQRFIMEGLVSMLTPTQRRKKGSHMILTKDAMLVVTGWPSRVKPYLIRRNAHAVINSIGLCQDTQVEKKSQQEGKESECYIKHSRHQDKNRV